jgi:porin
MNLKHIATSGLISLILLFGKEASAESLSGFGYIDSSTPAQPAPATAAKRTKQKGAAATAKAAAAAQALNEPWGPVPTNLISLVNAGPVLLPYFNNGPVFGLPGTKTGDFWSRTQVTGDWGGLRTEDIPKPTLCAMCGHRVIAVGRSACPFTAVRA